MPIPHLVEQAASFLKSSSSTPKEKLVIGGKLLGAAIVFSKDWTPQLLDRAKAAYKFLLKYDNIKKTVDQMDENAAKRCLAQFTKNVMQLAIDIEQVRSQQPVPRKS
jgi:hypothetical protein